MSEVIIDGTSLTLADVELVARNGAKGIVYTDDAQKATHRSRDLKLELIATGRPIYGVTTGFGDSVVNQISPRKAAELQRNLVRYHLNGTGPVAPAEVVRATLLIRANCLARGNSGVQTEIIERLLDLLRHDILPQVPERGSVGASGDLVPLCYVAAALFGEMEVAHGGTIRCADEVMRELGLQPIVPEAKDGLGLINGTSFSAAFAVLATHDAQRLATVVDICTSLASEALLGNRGHFTPFIHEQRPHRGQMASAALMTELLEGSQLSLPHDQVVDLNESLDGRGHGKLSRSIQDRYSIRCAPHVGGVLRDTVDWVDGWLETEINASTDNPLFDVNAHAVHSGGNFYAGHVVQAMDSLKVAVASVADLLDRQLQLMVDEKYNNGLTANLIPFVDSDDWAAGLHHGFKGMQLACSAITAEALKHAAPASVHSRSTEAHNQDKVSMAPIAARDARTILALAEEVAAIHLLAACQALDLRGTDLMSPRTRAVHELVRGRVPFVDKDRRMDADIAAVQDLVHSGALVEAALDRAVAV